MVRCVRSIVLVTSVIGTQSLLDASSFRTNTLIKIIRCTKDSFLSSSSSLPCHNISSGNTTHIVWPVKSDESEYSISKLRSPRPKLHSLESKFQDQLYQKNQAHFQIQPRNEAYQEALDYLHTNLMPFDKSNAETLGFQPSSSNLPDGLGNGIVHPTIELALDAKSSYPWTEHVPKSIYLEYVLNFANVNEARSNWRPLFHSTLASIAKDLVDDGSDVERVIHAVNQNLWTAFYGNVYSDGKTTSIVFKSGQTPLVYDPMSVIVYGYASCTGVSIMLVDALRAMGIPARLAGTDAWHGDLEDGGNHSWIEFYGGDGEWHIMESLPASGGKGGDDGGDGKELLDPCRWWFCREDMVKDSQFYAARLDRVGADGEWFPMSWDLNNHDVAGESRTDFMRDLCSNC